MKTLAFLSWEGSQYPSTQMNWSELAVGLSWRLCPDLDSPIRRCDPSC
jgi:hypothetical protein